MPVIDLRLFAWQVLQHIEALRFSVPQVRHEALDRVVPVEEPVTLDQVMVDAHGVAPEPHLRLDPGAVRVSHAHSLHGYFLRPGDTRVPILYVVDRIRDGSSFTTRRVIAVQHGKAIFNMAISFQVQEEGLSHQFEMPDVPPPEGLDDELALRRKIAHTLPQDRQEAFLRERPIEMRPVDPTDFFEPTRRPPQQSCWMKARDAWPDDHRLHQCVLAYLWDWVLLTTSMLPHAISWTAPNLQSASLDHALWFHRPFRADPFNVFESESNGYRARGDAMPNPPLFEDAGPVERGQPRQSPRTADARSGGEGWLVSKKT